MTLLFNLKIGLGMYVLRSKICKIINLVLFPSRSETLENRVTLFNITRARTRTQNSYFDDIKYFEKYPNLNTIFVDPPPRKTSVLSGTKFIPYICKGNECTLFRNQTEIYFPPACHCDYENQKIRLELNCTMIKYEVLLLS